MALLDLKDLTLSLGGPPILERVNLQIEPGERISLVGRNGEGKSTLLRILSGEVKPDSGEIVRAQGLRVGMLPQDVPTGLPGLVRVVVQDGFAAVGIADLLCVLKHPKFAVNIALLVRHEKPLYTPSP